MPDYRRWRHPGGSYFFTVNLADRRSDLLIREVGRLRSALAHVRASHPFHVEAAVILPKHLHMIWTLPLGERDFSTRWALIKARLSRDIARGERVSSSRVRRGEVGGVGCGNGGSTSTCCVMRRIIAPMWITSITTR